MTSLALDIGTARTSAAWYDPQEHAPALVLHEESTMERAGGPSARAPGLASLQAALDGVARRIPDAVPTSLLIVEPRRQRRAWAEQVQAWKDAVPSLRFGSHTASPAVSWVGHAVAAAAYRCWSLKGDPRRAVPDGATLLVLDMGASGLDLDLVRVGAEPLALAVIDGSSGPEGGDLADHLLCLELCRRYGAAARLALPRTPRDLQDTLSRGSMPFLTGWLQDCRELKRAFCVHAGHLRGGDWARLRPPQQSFQAPGHAAVEFALDRATFEDSLEPLYRRAGERLQQLLARQTEEDRPVAVVLTGGSAALHGLHERLLQPALASALGEPAARGLLAGIEVPGDRLLRPAALGAALIAAGVVQPLERLPHDIAITGTLSPALARALGMPPGPVLVTPVLTRGAVLPTTISSRDLGLIVSVGAERGFQLGIAIDAGPHRVQYLWWDAQAAGTHQPTSVVWRLTVVRGDLLRLEVELPEGRTLRLDGSLDLPDPGQEPEPRPVSACTASVRRVAPGWIREVIEEALAPAGPQKEVSR